jgi:hypothetical protein
MHAPNQICSMSATSIEKLLVKQLSELRFEKKHAAATCKLGPGKCSNSATLLIMTIAYCSSCNSFKAKIFLILQLLGPNQ